MVTIPTLYGKADQSVITAFNNLAEHANRLEGELNALKSQMANAPKPLSLQEISAGLSSSGAAPLNVNGLKGVLAP